MNFKINKHLNLLFIIILSLSFPSSIFAEEIKSWGSQKFSSKNEVSIAYFNDICVLAADSLYTSTNFETWEVTFSPNINGTYNQVAVLNDEFVATGNNVNPVKSKDGKVWAPLRLHENISIKDIKTIGNTYFSITSSNEFLYSNNLLTWANVPLEPDEKFIESLFINNKCFISTKINESTKNYWIIDENLNKKQIKFDLVSINDICYIPKINTYIKIVSMASTSSNELYYLTSTDGVNWTRDLLSFDDIKQTNINLNALNSKSLADKIFLNIGKNMYVTSDGLNYNKIESYGTYENLKYSGKYFYNVNNITDLFISLDGVKWKNISLENKLNISSNTNIFNKTLVILNNSFDTNKNLYESVIYTYKIDDLEQPISDIIKDNNINSKQPETSEIIPEQIEDSTPSNKIRMIESNDLIPLDTEVIKNEPKLKETIKIKINSKTIHLSNGNTIDISDKSLPFIENSTSLVPIRPIIEILGGSLDWNEIEKKITLTCNNKTIELWLNNLQAKIDNNDLMLPTNFKIIDNSAFVPIRFIIENLGYDIQWIDETKEILITY